MKPTVMAERRFSAISEWPIIKSQPVNSFHVNVHSSSLSESFDCRLFCAILNSRDASFDDSTIRLFFSTPEKNSRVETQIYGSAHFQRGTLLSEDGDEAVEVEDEAGEEVGEGQLVAVLRLGLVAVEAVKDGRVLEQTLKVPQRLQVGGRSLLLRQQT